MIDDRYVCSWCLEETAHPVDVRNRYCTCCGSDAVPLVRTCEHRTKSTLSDLFKRGVRLVRRDPWGPSNYLELQEIGGFMTPFGLVHSPLEWDGVPTEVAIGPQSVPLWRTPRGGWEAYTGPTVGERGGARKEPRHA
jgi:hypothetical protein